jgi:hypothetical protein
MPKLPFISDSNIDSAIEHVTSALSSLQDEKERIVNALANNQIFESSLFSNSMDPFAMKFGMALYGEEKWLETEITRQLYKTFEQRIGEFHQLVLGGVDGWVDLGTGDESQVDLKKEDNSIYIELKNKYNTCNSSSEAKVQEKLTGILDIYPDSKGYWAFIIPGVKKKYGTELWMSGRGKKATVRHERLYKTWGADVYKLVTGDGDNLLKLYELLNTANLNIPSTTQNLIEVSDEIVQAANPHLPAIKAKIYEEMLIGEPSS